MNYIETIRKKENLFYKRSMECKQGLTGIYIKYSWLEITEEEYSTLEEEQCLELQKNPPRLSRL